MLCRVMFNRISFFVVVMFVGCTIVHGQQNLFNIPSGDITPKGKWFLQKQVNVNAIDNYAVKAHFVYGLGKNWEIGANVVNMYFDFSQPKKFVTSTPYNSKAPYPYYPLGLVTAQKKWSISEHWYANVGTQMGINLANSVAEKRFTHFSYGMVGYQEHEKFKVVVGPYATDWRFVGGGNDVGVMAGTEIHLSHKWLFMADFISGNHKNSVSVAGFTYNVNKHFQLCAGFQIPNINSSERKALVLEINLFNF